MFWFIAGRDGEEDRKMKHKLIQILWIVVFSLEVLELYGHDNFSFLRVETDDLLQY